MVSRKILHCKFELEEMAFLVFSSADRCGNTLLVQEKKLHFLLLSLRDVHSVERPVQMHSGSSSRFRFSRATFISLDECGTRPIFDRGNSLQCLMGYTRRVVGGFLSRVRTRHSMLPGCWCVSILLVVLPCQERWLNPPAGPEKPPR
jgi:hypothetical protein